MPEPSVVQTPADPLYIEAFERQKLTLQALGLNKTNSSKEVEATPQILGMVRKVNHLITVEEVA